MYRDDIGMRKTLPYIFETRIPFDINGKVIILVDDVLQSGRSIRAALDAITDYGIDEAIRRANAYLDFGADIIFVESPETMEQIERIAAEVKGPVLFNNVEGGRSPFLSRGQLNALGIRAAIYPNMLTRIITKSCLDLLGELREHGTTEAMWDRMIPHKDLWPLFHSEDWYKTEQKYR